LVEVGGRFDFLGVSSLGIYFSRSIFDIFNVGYIIVFEISPKGGIILSPG
jgi:hypothetical protein